jgi:hypothetical protein
MTAPKDITLLGSSTLVAGDSSSGTSVAIDPNRYVARLVIEVTAIDAGATLKVFIDTGLANTGWTRIAETDNITAPGTYALLVIGVRARLRASWNLTDGGATLSVTGQSEQLYCEPQDVFNLALPAVALATVPPDVMAGACLAATDEAASYLAAYKDLPLKSWGYALRLHTSNMAAYHAVKRRGYNPDNDPTIRLGYTDAIRWLQGSGGGGAKSDPSMVDSIPEHGSESAYVMSEPSRGWGMR